MSARIYVVVDGDVKRLVKASSQAQAVGFVVRDKFKVHAANAIEVVDLIGGGMVVEDSSPVVEVKSE